MRHCFSTACARLSVLIPLEMIRPRPRWLTFLLPELKPISTDLTLRLCFHVCHLNAITCIVRLSSISGHPKISS
ncbi:hypothetical protein BJV78DRAFT_1224232 [Lactifluus subvellereus]|nr:hypothetical protein BJV78DRAFT_1224232 [Lactifluus subvellereus]